VDHPGQRKTHAQIVPFGGGLAIWGGVVIPLAICQLLLSIWTRAYRANPSETHLDLSMFGEWGTRVGEFIEAHLSGLNDASPDLWFFLAAGSVLMVLGLADDARKLDWRFRLSVEVVVAAVVVFGRGWKLTLFVDWPLATGILSVLWIVGLVNSFNMLD